MRKRLISLLLILVTVMLCAAEATAVSGDIETIVTTDRIGAETTCRLFDRSVYDLPSEQPGKIVTLKYKTTVYGEEMNRAAKVYLPFGYEAEMTQNYPIIYYLHGNEGNQNSFLGSDWNKNALDNMIMNGDVEPFILVAPTYYYSRKQLIDMDLFLLELRNDVMPIAESTYRTFAETPDAEGFIASRNMRALMGYSLGAFNTWRLMPDMMDYVSWFLPFSGGYSLELSPEESVNDLNGKLAQVPEEYRTHFFVYAACGDEEYDSAYASSAGFVSALIADGTNFYYGKDTAANNLYYCLSHEEHHDLASRFYLYNALKDVLFHLPA